MWDEAPQSSLSGDPFSSECISPLHCGSPCFLHTFPQLSVDLVCGPSPCYPLPTCALSLSVALRCLQKPGSHLHRKDKLNSSSCQGCSWLPALEKQLPAPTGFSPPSMLAFLSLLIPHHNILSTDNGLTSAHRHLLASK